MFQIRKPGVLVPAMSKFAIRNKATSITAKVRQVVKYDTVVPITQVLEQFGEGVFPGYNFEIKDDADKMMLHYWAYTDPVSKTIYIRDSIYHKACCGDPQARFTIAHEMGHLFLGHGQGAVLARKAANADIPIYYDAEWQADTFAAELLMPANEAKGKTCAEIQKAFHVSASAALARANKLKKEFQK